jgi:hypothetical protein
LPGVAWADDCRRLGRACRRDSQCCSRNCVRRGDDKVCGCPAGQTRCNDRCVNLQKNERHCGSCFNRCQTDQTYVGGVCCPDAQVCSTGTGLTCCAEGEQCGADGVCGPACGSNGDSCTEGTQCCSGNCKGGMCAESCIPPNAIPCDPSGIESCGGIGSTCGCIRESSSGGYCSSGGTGISCTTSCDCPAGQFCQVNLGLCTVAAEVCPTG